MKRFHISILQLSVIIIALSSCSKSSVNPTQDGNWIYVGDFGGKAARTEAVSFVIGNFAYVGTGLDNQNTRYNDLFRFDPSGTFWYQMSSCTGCIARSSAVAFAVNGKGYVGSGYDGFQALSDFWQYDPDANSWKQVSGIGDATNGLQPRYDAVAFGLDKFGFGYVGTGNDGVNLLNDFWQYDPANDKWIQKPTYPGFKRSQAIAFVYNDKGYLVAGLGTGGSAVNDFFSFDPSKTDTAAWTQLRHISNYSPDSYDDGYTSIMRYNGVGFVMLNTTSDGGGDRAYITTGSAGSTTWAYNFKTDLWNQKTSYERAARNGAVGFSVQNRGFVGLGTSGSTTLANIDEWKPDQTYNQQD